VLDRYFVVQLKLRYIEPD